ncbi:restriction endonuclease subunit S [Micromonospora sp. NPDC005223]|uniref:restriction endonuclease subunit S n=1 Tax=Micromonospora sp. NPDC005223 TaxID=3364227 RepID=UPI0036BAA881
MSDWQRTTLGGVTTQVSREVRVEDLTEARYAGVRWHVGGVYHRETIPAQKIKGKLLYRIKRDDIVYNRMWATKASFGVVKDDADGCYVTNDFPVLTVNPEAILPAYAEAIFHTAFFQSEAAGRAVGTTERRRLHVRDFASIPVLLPPLPVQARIVEAIGAVGDLVTALDAEADVLESVYLAATSLLWLTSHGDEAEARLLGDVMHLDVSRTPMTAGTIYRLAGVLNAGKGLVDKGEIDGADTEYTAMNIIRENQVVMRKLTAWEGPITVVSPEFDGFVASNEFPTFTLVGDIDPGWMKHVCRTPRLWAEMQNRVVGTVQRRKRLNPDQLLSVALPVPPRPEQEKVAEALDAIEGQIAVIRTEATSLRRTRQALLSGLLDRTIDIESAE